MEYPNTKNLQRLAFLALFLAAVYIRMYMLLASQILYFLSFEYLNSRPKYLKIPSHQRYNWFFISFVVFVVLVRSDVFGWSEEVGYHVNTAEHLYFSAVICLMLLIYLQLFNFGKNKITRLGLMFLALNFLGLLNEFFQNLFQERPFFSIEGNDIKDMIVNLIGSSAFVFFIMISKRKPFLTEENLKT